jgi:glutathione S-transferase
VRLGEYAEKFKHTINQSESDSMLTLHGFPFSNYHNIVKHALMQKGVPFDEHIVYPNTPEMLAVNPTGKAPAMTTEKGTQLSESSVLLEYLEDAYPEHSLFPEDVELRGRVRQLMKVSELYLELAARRLLPAVLGNIDFPQATLDEVKSVLERGAHSLTALANFGPYLVGSELTLADIYLRYALAIPKMVGPAKLDWNVMEVVPGLADWDAMMASTDIAQKIDADQKANATEFMAFISKPK